MTKPVEKITLESGRIVSRFIKWPKEVRDGTPRCIACGQIDEEPYHDSEICRDARAKAYEKYVAASAALAQQEPAA